jgi:pSer/pThr/pTyr-binding forkhead associated (FHA) protein
MSEEIRKKDNIGKPSFSTTTPTPLGNDATLIRDGDATSMGELPDMEMLALGARFAIVSHQDHGREFFISKKEMVIGRGEDCDLKMDYPGMSRKHFKVRYENKGILIEDLGSKFGILLGGKKADKNTRLKSGDTLQLGELTIKYLEGTATLSSSGNGTKKIILASSVVILLLFSVLLVKNQKKEIPVTPSQNAGSTPLGGLEAELTKKIETAQNLALTDHHDQALLQLDLVLEKDPGNLEALGLQKRYREKLSLQQKIIQAQEYFQSNNLEQARILISDILNLSPENIEAFELQKRIENIRVADKQQNILKDVKKLIGEGQIDVAKKLLASVKNAESQSEIESLQKDIQLREDTEVLFKGALDLFEKGELESSLLNTREGLVNVPDHAALKKLELKIETVQKLEKAVAKAFSDATPMQARESLKQILDLVGAANPLGQDVQKKLGALHSKAQVLGHLTYQETLGFLADGHLKEAMLRLDQLSKDFPEEVSYTDARNELRVRLDNLGRAMFRAGYVLEEKDSLKAKEIWQRLLSYLPDDHPYARKAQAKIAGK